MSLEDLLSDEPSAIDDFIRRKFAETKMTHLLGRTKVEVQVNPPGDQVIGPHQLRRGHCPPKAEPVMMPTTADLDSCERFSSSRTWTDRRNRAMC